MAHKYCLRCAGTCATYAIQCMHCQHNFNQPFVSNKDDNRTIVLLLNQWRQGKTLTEITGSLKNAEIKP